MYTNKKNNNLIFMVNSKHTVHCHRAKFLDSLLVNCIMFSIHTQLNDILFGVFTKCNKGQIKLTPFR